MLFFSLFFFPRAFITPRSQFHVYHRSQRVLTEIVSKITPNLGHVLRTSPKFRTSPRFGVIRTSPRFGVIFDTISVKARWKRWCRWNCDLKVINVRIKGIFWRAEGVAMTPKSRDHTPTTSLWGVAAKWPTRAPKTKLILCPRDPQGYSRISLSLSGRILYEYRNIVLASTCGIPWGLRNRTHRSARYTNGRDGAQQESQLVWFVST